MVAHVAEILDRIVIEKADLARIIALNGLPLLRDSMGSDSSEGFIWETHL